MPGTLGRVGKVGLSREEAVNLKIVLLLLALFILCQVQDVGAQDGTVTSQLSAGTITRDETVTLQIVATGLDAELDVSSLNKDFDVVGRSSSREVSTVMGASGGLRTTSIVTWALQLAPKEVGIFTVPPVSVGNISSQSHSLTVNALPTGAKRDLFIEASVDTQEPWVQSQVLMTISVFQAIEIVDGGMDNPTGENVVVERLGDDTSRTEIRDGRQYSVTERRFALFPQKSGEMLVNPVTLSVSVPANPNQVRSFFSPTRKLTRRSESVSLNVRPRPNSGSAWWLPARALQLTSQWVGDVNAAEVDKPLTRTITLRAAGVADSQLPDIIMPAIEGASLYAEQPERKSGANQQGLISELTINWALIPQRAGELALPAVAVDWFNTRTGKVETATLAAETIQVKAGGQPVLSSNSGTGSVSNGVDTSNGTSTAITASLNDNPDGSSSSNGLNVSPSLAGISSNDPSTDGEVSGESLNTELASLQRKLAGLDSAKKRWQIIAAALGLLMILLLFVFWRSGIAISQLMRSRRAVGRPLGAVRRVSNETVTRLYPLSGVAVSCKQGSPAQIKASLLEWSARQWPENPPSSLDALKNLLPDSDAAPIIQQINEHLYGHAANSPVEKTFRETLVTLPGALKKSMGDSVPESSLTSVQRTSSSPHGLPSL